MKNIDNDLKQTTEYLENVLENSPDAIGIVDANGKFIKWNRMAARLYGFSFHELKGKSAFDLYDSPEELSAMLDKLREHGVIKNYEINMKRKDGTVIPFDMSMSLLTDGMNNVVGSVCVARDLSEVKKTLSALEAANEQLQRFAVELEQKNEEIKQFAYIVSHDLRASLVNLKGFAGELRYGLEVVEAAIHDKVISCLDEKQRMAVTAALKEDLPEALGFIESSVTRMDQFTSAVLMLARLGRRDLDFELLDMDSLTKTILDSLAHQIGDQRIEVRVAPLPQVVADRTSMEQIMGNLLSNAVNYIGTEHPRKIEISAERGDDETTFFIRDNGRGIRQEDMPKVFAPFRRAGKQDKPGEGMGLAYVQTIVRRHGGRIWCESEFGVGTRFAFTISNYLAKE